jgi:RNA polymerase sigma factor (sigma-70 family)
MKRPIPSGRSPGPGGDANRDESLGMVRLAQFYLETCRTKKPICPLIERAWLRFYSETDELVRAAARSCHIDSSRLDDCVQEAWREILAFLPGYRHDPARGRFRNWIFVLVRRTLIRHKRRERGWVFETLPEGDEWPGREPDPARSLDRVEMRKSLIHSLTVLRVRVSRMGYHVVVLHHVAEQSESEVADRLALSPGQVRGYLDRARARLRACPPDSGGQELD